MITDIIVNGRRVARDEFGSGFFLHRGVWEGGSDMEQHPTLSPDGGGGGATVGMEGFIRYTTVSAYAAHGPAGSNGPAGLSFLIFHEMAHMTNETRSFYTEQFALYRARNPGLSEQQLVAAFDGEDIEFRRNEQFANIAAVEMMRSAGLTTPSEIYASPNEPLRRTRQNFPVFGLAVEG